MTSQIDLEPAARRLAELVQAVPADALSDPTPCAAYTVGDLLDHVAGSVAAFRAAAVKDPLPGGASGDASKLPPDWRVSVPRDALALAAAWADPAAWSGMTAAGGVDLPAGVAGVVALDELVIHGWDVAAATGQRYDYDGPGLDAVFALVQQFRGAGIEGLFGPPVPVAADAPLLEQVLGAAGRDPRWTSPKSPKSPSSPSSPAPNAR
jgi:uncharacterized protein (TIGR03086 family)